MTSTTLASRLTLITLLFFPFGSALADPSELESGMDDPESRAKVLLEALNQFTKNKEYEKAFDAASAMHKLKPSFRGACAAAALAQKIGANVRAAELFSECLRFAIAEKLSKRDPTDWENIQADYDCAISRVGIIRVHAPLGAQVKVDDRDYGFANDLRDIFVVPNVSHRVSATSDMGVVIEKSVNVNAGARHEIEFKPEEMQPAKAPVIPIPAPLPPVIVQQPIMLVPDPYAQPVYIVNQVPAASWVAFSGGIAMAATTLYLANEARLADARANTMAMRTIKNTRGHCDVFRNEDACFLAAEKREQADKLFHWTVASGLITSALFGASAFLYVYSVPFQQGGAVQKFAGGFSIRGGW